jgi:hypothetical protein
VELPDPQIVDGSAQRELDAAKARFRAAGIVDYHYDVSRICFCVPAFRGPATIVVRDGRPLGASEAFADVATVPRLIGKVQQAIDDQVASLAVRYDEHGVPVQIQIDRSRRIADEEVGYEVSGFTVDHPYAAAKGDVVLRLRWEGPGGNARRILVCTDGELATRWPDVAVCARVLAATALRAPITIETRDLRPLADPLVFTVRGSIEGQAVSFTWRSPGSSTRIGRLRAWEAALGADAIAAVRS